MPEVTLLIILIAMVALKAAAVVGLVFIGIRLAIGEAVISPDLLKRLRLNLTRLRAATRKRHYHGTR